MFPGGWVPDTVVLESTFLINTSPLITHSTHSTIREYGQFLIRRFSIPHFLKGVKEVHILFDRPACNLRTPKAFEQSHRDAEHSVSSDHEHFAFSDVAQVRQKWRKHLNCRQCKQ